MNITTNEKTPVAELGGDRDEGLESTPNKEQIMHQSTVPTRLDLDGLSTDIEPTDDSVNITFVDPARWIYGINITRADARKFASALLDASAPDFGSAPLQELDEHAEIGRRLPVEVPVSDLATGTVTDIFRFAQDHEMSSAAVMRAVEDYIHGMAEAERVSPAQWCKRRRQQGKTNR